MIDFVQGNIASVEEDSIIVNVNGIGYQIYVARPESFMKALNQTSFIYTHHHIREDWFGLFGFKDKEERQLFRLLLSVSGIGPKGAMAIIAQSNPTQVINAIALEDEKSLCKMPGVGKKTAQRIILDLKDKVKDLTLSKDIAYTSKEVISTNETQSNTDLYDALKVLGYNDQEINRTMIKMEGVIDSEPLDTLIKKAITILMKE